MLLTHINNNGGTTESTTCQDTGSVHRDNQGYNMCVADYDYDV